VEINTQTSDPEDPYPEFHTEIHDMLSRIQADFNTGIHDDHIGARSSQEWISTPESKKPILLLAPTGQDGPAR